MTKESRILPLSEAALINPSVKLQRGETYPFVDMAALQPGRKFVTGHDVRIFAGGGAQFKSGDTLMARITPCLENGKIAMYRAPDISPNAHGSTEFIVFRGRPGVSSSEFVHYLVTSPKIRDYAIRQMTGTSGRQRVPNSAFDHISVFIPSLKEQAAIVSILCLLDDKIELNRRMNETLETIARAIFKDWFIDFGPTRAKIEGRAPYLASDIWCLFPDHVDADGLPKGWKWEPVRELVQLNPGEALKRGVNAPYLDMAALPTSGPTPEPAIQSMTGTSGRQRARTEALASYPVARPSDKTIWSAFGSVIEPLFDRVRLNGEESRTLAQTRDLLLPKLMSGEIRLREAQKAVEVAA